MSRSDHLVVRPADESDLPGLLELYRHLNADDAPCSLGDAVLNLRRLLRYDGSAIFLGLSGNAPVASCTLVVIPNLTRGGAPYALIENVVTHAGHRNLGFGKALLKAATNQAWAAGCYKAMLMTGSKEPSTLAFYLGAGFEQSKTGFQMRRVPARQ